HWWQWQPKSPFPQVSGLGAAVQIFAESQGNGMVPMNIDTQNARSRVWNGKDLTFNDNLAWVKGKHFFQFGGEFRHEAFFHQRDDKVVGALTSPVYFDEKVTKITIASAFQPVACGDPTANPPIPGPLTNCLKASDVGQWNSLYAATLGMLDHGSRLLTR